MHLQHTTDTANTLHLGQFAAGIHGFFWPKVFWDFITKNLDGAVKPVPVLQIFNVIFGLMGLALEWPLKPVAGTMIHRSIEARLLLLPVSTLLAALLYQGTNPAIYYIVGMIVYVWGYSEGEVRYQYLDASALGLDCWANLFLVGRLPRTVDIAQAAWPNYESVMR